MGRSDKQRQADVDKRRRESGLITKKCYFLNDTIDGIETLADELGFEINDLRKSEDFSSIIEYCVSLAYEHHIQKEFDEPPKSKNTLYLWKIHKIIVHRSKQHDDKETIAKFMTHSNYQLPLLPRKVNCSGEKLYKLVRPKSWNKKVIEILIDKEKVMLYIKQTEQSINSQT
ncbi:MULTISPECIES: hypothetical protein [Photobacterium]|uniref:hypothetical protein n=1 Tax=Photobacterium TaxID=657 RepID=UPI000D17E131|nr:hypothetical protein [Photobacterium leiognathi]PSW56846.1 hypothetical protein C0W50_10910 [Photobacterium leiognathi subsp. mandapamensis]